MIDLVLTVKMMTYTEQYFLSLNECFGLTERETEAVDRCGRLTGDTDLLVLLSTQSRQVRAEVYSSLQHMRLQRAQLQNNMRQPEQIRDSSRKKHQKGVSYINLDQIIQHQTWLSLNATLLFFIYVTCIISICSINLVCL